MNSGTTLLLPVRPKSFSLYMNKVPKNLYITPSPTTLFPAFSYNATSPLERLSVPGGFIRYFGFVLEGSGNPYANRP